MASEGGWWTLKGFDIGETGPRQAVVEELSIFIVARPQQRGEHRQKCPHGDDSTDALGKK